MNNPPGAKTVSRSQIQARRGVFCNAFYSAPYLKIHRLQARLLDTVASIVEKWNRSARRDLDQGMILP